MTGDPTGGPGSGECRHGTALAADNRALQSLLAACEVPVLMLDREMRVRRYTPAAERAFGLLASDKGRRLASVKLGLEAPKLPQVVRAVIQGLFLAKRLEVRDHRQRWYSLWVRPYKPSADTIDGAILTLTDITERVQGLSALEASRSFAEAVVDTADNAVLVLNRHLKVKKASRTYHEIFREHPGGLAGRSVYELGDGRWNIPPLRKALAALIAQGTPFAGLEGEFEVPRVGRRTLSVSGRSFPNGSEGEASVVISFEDVSLRRQAAEAGLLRRNEARQREFVANISHELLTPITAIKGYAESLSLGAIEHSGKRGKFVQIIERNADRLAQLVEDLLQLSSHDPGRARRAPDCASLWAAADKAAREVGAAARRRRVSIRLRIAQRLKVAMNRSELGQVLQILCENAVKYNRKDGRVYVTARRIGKRAVVSVQDTGIGVPSRDLPFVFDRFHRAANARARTAHGNGLGLSIARAILVNRGCRIWLESVEGKGTIAHFTLPMARRGRRKRGVAPSRSRGNRVTQPQ